MLPVIDEAFHHYPMIGGNGSLIAKEGKLILSHSFSVSEFEEIKKLITRYGATYLIDGEWDYAYTGSEGHPILQNLDSARLAKMVRLEELDSVVKVLFLTSDNMEKLAEKLSKLLVYVNKHGNENVLDISPSEINKWSALRYLGIKEHIYIVFGNDANDSSMFKNALHTVMIGSHEHLVPLSKEKIPLDRDYER